MKPCPSCNTKHRKFPDLCYIFLENSVSHSRILFGSYEPYKSSKGDEEALIKTIKFKFDPFPYPEINREYCIEEIQKLILMKNYISNQWPNRLENRNKILANG